MKLNHAVFIHTVQFNGMTFGYIDSNKHKLNLYLKDNYIIISNENSSIYTPVANCKYFEVFPVVGNFANVATVDLPKKSK